MQKAKVAESTFKFFDEIETEAILTYLSIINLKPLACVACVTGRERWGEGGRGGREGRVKGLSP